MLMILQKIDKIVGSLPKKDRDQIKKKAQAVCINGWMLIIIVWFACATTLALHSIQK